MYVSRSHRSHWPGLTWVSLIIFGVVACDNPQPPASCGPLPQVTVNAGETTTVSACFNDPNGDMLTYLATSSNPGVATASISGTSVTVAAVAPGNASVTITATDPEGLQGQQGFQVMVPNRPPQPRGTIPSVSVSVGRTATVDASSYFTDPDGDDLAYSVTSSNSGVARGSVSGSTLTVSAVAPGTATITVTANDPDGATATQGINVTVRSGGGDAPDLVFTDVSPRSQTVARGDTVRASFTLRNNGSVASTATTVRVFASEDSTITANDTELLDGFLPAYPANAEHILTVRWPLSSTAPLITVYWGLCIDPVAGESDTTNNCSAGVRLTIAASSSSQTSSVVDFAGGIETFIRSVTGSQGFEVLSSRGIPDPAES